MKGDKKNPRQEVMDKILSALSYFTVDELWEVDELSEVDELWEILVALAKKKKNGNRDPKNGGKAQE
jgi:hypothetical protein